MSAWKDTLLRRVRQHPNLTILIGVALAWWLWGGVSAKYETYRYEQEWLLIEPPPKSVSELGPDLAAPAGEWGIVAVCPSWIACERFLSASRECAAMNPDQISSSSHRFQESVTREKCVARADPEGPFERFDPQPTFGGCDPSWTFAPKNCVPHKAASR